jgi:hypothetical protein
MIRYLTTSALCVAALAGTAHAQSSPTPAGRWEGELQIPGKTLGLAVDLDRGADGWIGSLTIPMTTTADVPIERISVENSTVRFNVRLPGDTMFEGTLSGDAQQLSGLASNAQGGVAFQLARKGDAHVRVPPASSALTSDFEGVWEGSVEAGARTIRTRVIVSKAADGRAAASIVNLDQPSDAVPATTVSIEGKTIHLDVRIISGTYRGTLGAAGEIVGEWGQGGARAPLTLRKPAPQPQ